MENKYYFLIVVCNIVDEVWIKDPFNWGEYRRIKAAMKMSSLEDGQCIV